MSDWTNIPDATFDPDKPILGSTHLAIVKNFGAFANGDAGAPRLQNAAINDAAVTASKLATSDNERDWVAGRTAGIGAGVVGSYALMQVSALVGSAQGPGDTLAGSSLRFSDAAGARISATVPDGTWRCMGSCGSGSDAASERVTLWLRIS